ncbi:MAG: hypothetical protein IKA78_00080 [Oscillospiraceae bacterium]|nr:hypothetical protein [Oscillospiraceae bacterium]MBR2365550.1 hypothetical protein [Oscillospiraceae bacterium]
MMTIEEIRLAVQRLFEIAPVIHVDVSINRPRIRIEDQVARITGVYRNIFQIEAEGKSYTLQYADILMGSVRISELAEDGASAH